MSELGTPDVMRLAGVERSRVFQAWSEFDPERGLEWLKRAVRNATDEDLRNLDDVPGGAVGYDPRRQIVWLCEHLASFAEHFWDCEEVLFRLAQVETEPSIANNSTGIWFAMFWPVLSNTEVPFLDRLHGLLTRLHKVTDQTFELVISAALDVLDYHSTGMSMPSVVGGRVVPDRWNPGTFGDLRRVKQEAGREILRCIGELPKDIRSAVVSRLLGKIVPFLNANLATELRNLMAGVEHTPELLRTLRATLDDYLGRAERRHAEDAVPACLEDVRSWRNEIDPVGLVDEIMDLTAREFWSVVRTSKEENVIDDPSVVFRELAHRAIAEPEAIESLGDWFDSSACMSGGPLAFEIGRLDTSGTLKDATLGWLADDRAADFAAEYLRGLRLRIGNLPSEAIHVLDDLIQSAPRTAVHVTLRADVSAFGFERLLKCLHRLDSDDRFVLLQLAYPPWEKSLDDTQKSRLLDRVIVLSDEGDQLASRTAFELLAGWSRQGKVRLPESLASQALSFVCSPSGSNRMVDAYHWKVVVGSLSDIYPAEVADILADAITKFTSSRLQRREYGQELLKGIAATHPQETMQALGRYILDEQRRPTVRIMVFRGLFESIEFATVQSWVLQHGVVAASSIAGHLNAPYIDDEGRPAVPELTDWLLTHFADDEEVFHYFCSGRHAWEMRWGHAIDQQKQVMALTKAFSNHPKKWVRDWVKYELDSLTAEIKLEEEIDDERNRS